MGPMRNVKAELRRTRLRELAGTNQAALARRIGRSQSFLNSLLNDEKKSFGEKLARDIEHRLQLYPGWLDRPEDGAAATPPSSDSGIERRHLALLQSYLSLPEETRFAVRMLIETLAGAQNPRLHRFMQQIEAFNHERDGASPVTSQKRVAKRKG